MENTKYIKPFEIVKQYSMSRSTVYRLMQKMKEIDKYKNTVLDLGHKMKLVKIDEWEQFLEEYSQNR